MASPVEPEARSGGFWLGSILVLLGCGGVLALGVVIVAAGLLVLGPRPPASETTPLAEASDGAAGEGEAREFSMTVCADERAIRVLSPAPSALAQDDWSVVPGRQVGRVGTVGAPDVERLAAYGWVAAETAGGIVRWWQPEAFADWSEAELGIRQVLAYCEVCCAAGTVVERAEGGRTVWLQDDRFATAQGVAVGGSFAEAVSAAPSGTRVERDEMDGMPTVDLGGATAYSAFDKDRVEMLVVHIDP